MDKEFKLKLSQIEDELKKLVRRQDEMQHSLMDKRHLPKTEEVKKTAAVKTVKITNRPSQDGVVNGILLD